MLKYDSSIEISMDNSHSLILRNIASGSKVLEFGPATGSMTRYMKEELNCRVWCVELDPQSAEVAKQYCEKMIVADIEQFTWVDQLAAETFNVIIFADVLEHLRDPWAVLRMALPLLKKNGIVLTSIPNVGHNAIIMDLLEGKFDYRNLGLLDDTHVRFFTKKSVFQMLNEVGLSPVKWLATYKHPEETEFEQKYEALSEPIQRFLQEREEGHVYQYVTVSKKTVDIHPSEIVKDVIIPRKNRSDRFLQLFWENGGIYSESKSVRATFNMNNGFSEYIIKLPIEASRLRFDPINCPSLIELQSIEVCHEDVESSEAKQVDLCHLQPGTGIILIDTKNTYKFICTNNDPQFYLEIDGLAKINTSHYFLKFVLQGSDQIEEMLAILLNKQEEQLKEKQSSLNNLSNRNVELMEQLTSLSGRISYYADQILNQSEQISRFTEQMSLHLEQTLDLKDQIVQKDETTHKLSEHIALMKEQAEQDMQEIASQFKQKEEILLSKENEIVQLYQQIDHLNHEIGIRDLKLSKFKGILGDKEEQLFQRFSDLNELHQEVNQQTELVQQQVGEINNLKTQLDLIYNSQGWKTLLKYYSFRDRLLPEGSYRREGLKRFWIVSKKIRNYKKEHGTKALYYKVKDKLFSSKEVQFMKSEEIEVPFIEPVLVAENEYPVLEKSTISVVIPTLNAGTDFITLLPTLRNQKGIKDVEIVVVDSGSTDDTVALAEKYGAKVISITQEQFSHSYARNLGAEHATGNYILFMTQDALPSTKSWMYEMFSALENNDAVAVSCAETPREDSDLFYRVISAYHYRFMGVENNDRVTMKPSVFDYVSLRKNSQLSDVSCMVDREVFMKYKFRNDYAEDLDLGIRLINDGYKLALLGTTKVIHSHNRTPYYHLKRGYVDNTTLQCIFSDYPISKVKSELLLEDIIFTYYAITGVVNQYLLNIKSPCRVEELVNISKQKLDEAYLYNYPTIVHFEGNKYIDDKLKIFLEKVYRQYPNSGSNRSYDGNLLQAVTGMAGVVFEYTIQTYDFIDADILEDFIASLYKVFAIQAGAHFAYSCFTSESDEISLREFTNELAKGV